MISADRLIQPRPSDLRRADSRASRPSPTARIATALLVASLATSGASSASAQAAAPRTDDEKAFYAVGTALAGNLQQFKPISDRELELVVQGLRDVVGDKTIAVDQKEGGALIRTMMTARQEKSATIESAAATKFLAAEAAKPGAKKTGSGLIITQIKPGTGPAPAATDTVRVHYHGTLRDGSVFDSSVERGQPAEFPLNRVIPCWTEGVALMKVGGKARLVCPAEIAYGSRGAPPRILPGAALAFEVELIEIVK